MTEDLFRLLVDDDGEDADDDQAQLLLETGSLPSDDAVAAAGHEPNGEFWTGVAEYLVQTHAPELEGKFEFDPEAGMFAAYGHRVDLEKLRELMLPVAGDGEAVGALIDSADEDGFEFDD